MRSSSNLKDHILIAKMRLGDPITSLDEISFMTGFSWRLSGDFVFSYLGPTVRRWYMCPLLCFYNSLSYVCSTWDTNPIQITKNSSIESHPNSNRITSEISAPKRPALCCLLVRDAVGRSLGISGTRFGWRCQPPWFQPPGYKPVDIGE